jgi:hypothetical protein
LDLIKMLGVGFKRVRKEVLTIRELVKLQGSFEGKWFLFFITSRARSCLIQDGLVDDEVVKQFQDGTFLRFVDKHLFFHALNARLSCQRLRNQVTREQTSIFSEIVWWKFMFFVACC